MNGYWEYEVYGKALKERDWNPSNNYFPPKATINSLSINHMKLDFVKVQKKPLNVQAFQITKEWLEKINKRANNEFKIYGYKIVAHNAGLIIETLEGLMNAKIGDWIIKGVEGEIYSCDESIFNKSYIFLEQNDDE